MDPLPWSPGDAVMATWGSWDDDQQRATHDAWFTPGRLSVVVYGGQDAGVLDNERRGNMLYVARIELLPQFQNLGIGTRLVGQLVDDARRSGAAAVELDVLEANEGARRLYERLGFEVVATSPPKQRMRLAVR